MSEYKGERISGDGSWRYDKEKVKAAFQKFASEQYNEFKILAEYTLTPHGIRTSANYIPAFHIDPDNRLLIVSAQRESEEDGYIYRKYYAPSLEPETFHLSDRLDIEINRIDKGQNTHYRALVTGAGHNHHSTPSEGIVYNIWEYEHANSTIDTRTAIYVDKGGRHFNAEYKNGQLIRIECKTDVTRYDYNMIHSDIRNNAGNIPIVMYGDKTGSAEIEDGVVTLSEYGKPLVQLQASIDELTVLDDTIPSYLRDDALHASANDDKPWRQADYLKKMGITLTPRQYKDIPVTDL